TVRGRIINDDELIGEVERADHGVDRRERAIQQPFLVVRRDDERNHRSLDDRLDSLGAQAVWVVSAARKGLGSAAPPTSPADPASAESGAPCSGCPCRLPCGWARECSPWPTAPCPSSRRSDRRSGRPSTSCRTR